MFLYCIFPIWWAIFCYYYLFAHIYMFLCVWFHCIRSKLTFDDAFDNNNYKYMIWKKYIHEIIYSVLYSKWMRKTKLKVGEKNVFEWLERIWVKGELHIYIMQQYLLLLLLLLLFFRFIACHLCIGMIFIWFVAERIKRDRLSLSFDLYEQFCTFSLFFLFYFSF